MSLTSNGSLLDRKRAEEILTSGLEWINFSIDGLDKRIYEHIRKGLKFEEVLGNVLQFIMLRNAMESKVSVRISIIKNSAYLEEMEKIVSFWEKILDSAKGDSIKIDELNFGITNKSKDKGLKNYEYDRKKIFAQANNLPCYVIWNHLVIKADGQVALCCVDQCRNISLGNLQEQSIKEIWQNSEKLKQIRQEHLKKGRASVECCKDCLCWL